MERILFLYWDRNQGSEELIAEVARYNPGDIIVKECKGKITRGSYVHPDLIVDIARWCSPKYGVNIAKIVHHYNSREFEKSIRLLNGEKNDLISMVYELRKENKEAQKENKEAQDIIKKNTGEILDQNRNLKNDVKMWGKKAVKLCHYRVQSDDPDYTNMLVVIKNNDVFNKKKPKVLYTYSVKRIAKKNFNDLVSKHRAKHPNMEVVLELDAPNAVILWNNIRDRLGHKVVFNGCNHQRLRFFFLTLKGNATLKKKYTEEKFIKDIKAIHRERYNHDDI